MVAKIASSLGLTSPKDVLQNIDGKSPTPTTLTSLSNSGAINPNGPVADVLRNMQSNSLSAGSVLQAVTSAIIRATDDVCDNSTRNRWGGSGNMRGRRPRIHDNCEMTAKGRIERALGISLSSIPAFAADVASNIAIAYKDKLQSATLPGLVNAAGEVLRIAKSGESDKAAQLARTASRFFNAPELAEFVDERSQLAISITMLDAALNLGAIDIVDKIIERHEEQPAIKQAMMENVPLTIIRSDLITLNKIMDTIGVTGVLKAAPDAIVEILRFYRFETNYDVSKFPEYRELLISTLLRIDPNWDTIGDRTNLGPFITASDHSKQLLSLPSPTTTDATLFDDTYIRACRTAEHYRIQTPAIIARDMYPFLVL